MMTKAQRTLTFIRPKHEGLTLAAYTQVQSVRGSMLPLDEAILEFLAQPLGTANTFVH